jgi:hypothetical protein
MGEKPMQISRLQIALLVPACERSRLKPFASTSFTGPQPEATGRLCDGPISDPSGAKCVLVQSIGLNQSATLLFQSFRDQEHLTKRILARGCAPATGANTHCALSIVS